jgi:hypothetical protein
MEKHTAMRQKIKAGELSPDEAIGFVTSNKKSKKKKKDG